MKKKAVDLRKKRMWTVSDFVAWCDGSMSHWQAKTFLERLDVELHGMLLHRSKGTNRRYWFFPAALAKAKPELFERLEGLEIRIDALEEDLGDVRAAQRRIVQQVGANTRDINKIRSGKRVA